MQLSFLGKAETTAGSAGKISEADRETDRIKKDLANAKFEAVSLSEAVRKLEEQLKPPGEPSRAMVAVPLATQLSEALRAETASRKEIWVSGCGSETSVALGEPSRWTLGYPQITPRPLLRSVSVTAKY